MDQEAVGNIVLLAIVTLISVVQNGFFAHKVEHESKTHNGRSFQRTGPLAFERVYTANQNCVDAYPTFLVMLWSAGLLCSQAHLVTYLGNALSCSYSPCPSLGYSTISSSPFSEVTLKTTSRPSPPPSPLSFSSLESLLNSGWCAQLIDT
ncbi:arachidonate 5-lipoxygenase-activating protein isoform X4 [Ovis aries]|uniref:Arachidonate 5-lipoxygenase activating protein n=1 Tax=Ovis aries TaxID=9940 RepID=A0AC11DM23_SHEEP|nr:arachidonate 5-lipoxygenase-activating protein isoform X4 [Ovis aries]